MYYAAPSTIHRRLKKWLAEGRFELQDKTPANNDVRVISRDDSLGEELVRRTGIWRARVVRIAGVEAACAENNGEQPHRRERCGIFQGGGRTAPLPGRSGGGIDAE